MNKVIASTFALQAEKVEICEFLQDSTKTLAVSASQGQLKTSFQVPFVSGCYWLRAGLHRLSRLEQEATSRAGLATGRLGRGRGSRNHGGSWDAVGAPGQARQTISWHSPLTLIRATGKLVSLSIEICNVAAVSFVKSAILERGPTIWSQLSLDGSLFRLLA